ncbi:excalibur calcium-binding domain-containing protein [Rhizobiales bacterium L72]|uniref:Excalibur calcium-binding domain-containing protein n=2 Tax=Propylenella binzhouense TaxID=2555902 RepID=A0A964T2C8_9HYPH|nr:excalibur calcium-binding domain-containing protein [Propylenella binzhouense]
MLRLALWGVAAGFVLYLTLATLSPWPPTTTLRHVAAASNCGVARMLDVAPARRGEPGYWRRLDRDGDGIACERI